MLWEKKFALGQGQRRGAIRNSVGFCPQANYGDREAAAFADRGVSPVQRNESPRPLLCFLYRNRHFFIQVAPQSF
jgi:hypothetical protein